MAKSKLPDVQEITKYAGKLFKDIKESITGICQEYSEARAAEEEKQGESKPEAKKEAKPDAKKEAKAESKPKEAPKQADANPGDDKSSEEEK